MNWDQTLAVVSIGGFAVQRSLDVLDFILTPAAFGIKKRLDNSPSLKDWGVTEPDVKKWMMALTGFVIGLLITRFTGVEIVSAVNEDWKTLDVLVGALAISGGSEGFNSVLKFANHAKEARKIEVRPLPEIKVLPEIATVTPETRIRILASVAGTDVKTVTWELLETVEGAAVDAATGEFTAPAEPGVFHIVARSTDNPEAKAVATITVREVAAGVAGVNFAGLLGGAGGGAAGGGL